MTITIKIPLRNCFQKFWRDTQSSNTNTRLWLSVMMAVTASDGDMPKAFVTCQMMSSNAANMHVVCSVSVHTSVLMPPRRVYNQMSATMQTTVSANGTPSASSTNRCSMIQTT